MIHGLFQIKICFNIFRKNQDLQASCSFLFYMLLEIWTNSTATRRGSLGCWLQMGDAKKLLEIWCSMAWSATWWRTRLPPVKSEQHSSMQQALTQFKAFAGQGQPDKRIGKGKENESWKVLKNPVNPNVGWRFRVCRIKRYHVLAHVSTMLSPKYFTHCLFCSPFCKFIFYSNIRRDLFNATKRLIETCRSELHTLNPKCVFFVPIIETFKVWFQVRFRAEDPNLAHPFAVGSTGHSFGGCRFKQLVGFKWCLHHKKTTFQHIHLFSWHLDVFVSPASLPALRLPQAFGALLPGGSAGGGVRESGSGETWLGVGFSDRPTRPVSIWNLVSFKFTYILMVSLLLISFDGLSLMVWLTNNNWGYDKSSGFNQQIYNRQG